MRRDYHDKIIPVSMLAHITKLQRLIVSGPRVLYCVGFIFAELVLLEAQLLADEP